MKIACLNLDRPQIVIDVHRQNSTLFLSFPMLKRHKLRLAFFAS